MGRENTLFFFHSLFPISILYHRLWKLGPRQVGSNIAPLSVCKVLLMYARPIFILQKNTTTLDVNLLLIILFSKDSVKWVFGKDSILQTDVLNILDLAYWSKRLWSWNNQKINADQIYGVTYCHLVRAASTDLKWETKGKVKKKAIKGQKEGGKTKLEKKESNTFLKKLKRQKEEEKMKIQSK